MKPTENDDKPPRKKPGPVRGVPTGKYNLLLEEDLAEWGKHQPGGLSELIRRLLRGEWERATGQKSLADRREW